MWQLKIQSPASAATSLHFDRFELAPDQQLWIYNPNGSSQYGPYTAAHRNQYGQLWSPAVEGETIVVELHSQEKTDTALNIAAVNHSYDSWWKNQNNLKSSAGGCNVDAVCLVNEDEQGNHPNHSDKIRATARMTYRDDSNGLFRLCSGTLINNGSQDGRPYFLTANHCVDSDNEASTVNTYWAYQRACCTAPAPNLDNAIGNAVIRATWEVTDFTLLELAFTPTSEMAPYWSGWDRTQNSLFSAVGVHHPQGDVKKISYRDSGVQVVNGPANDPVLRPDAQYVLVSPWSLGTTEGGSSGSALWKSAYQIVGQLRGGSASCANPSGSDYYGWMGQSWEGGGAAENRLRDWLDPNNLGLTTMNGFDFINQTANAGNLHCGTIPPPSGGGNGGLLLLLGLLIAPIRRLLAPTAQL